MEFDADLPITKRKEDLYNRATFAKSVTSSILTLGLDKSFVIGLYGEWGYGKTSTLNLIKKELGDQAIIIDLEPWTYCEGRELAAGLFYELQEKLNPGSPFLKLCNWYEKRKGDLTKVADGAEESAGALHPSAGKILGAIRKISQALGSLRTYQKLKLKIEREIRRASKPVVVFIDNIDRLDGKEILNSFKLIKSVANIRGLHYVLAIDQEHVSKNIKVFLQAENDDNIGIDYLEKIVQMPLELPVISEDDLGENLLRGIIDILADCGTHVTDNEMREIGSFCREVQSSIKTPRTVARCLNALRFTVPSMQGEANISDLVRIELIRILHSDTYQAIRNNQSLFTNEGGKYVMDDELEQRKAKIKELIPSQEDRWLISKIFPIINKYFNNVTDWRDERKDRRTRRICSTDYIGRYFVYGIGKDDISDQNIIKTLGKQNIEPYDLAKLLKKQPLQALRKVRDYADRIANPDAICRNLVLVAEKLPTPNSETGASFWEDPVEHALYTIEGIMLAKQYNSSDALKIYEHILNNHKEPKIIFHLAHYIESRAKENSPKRLLNQSDKEKLQDELVADIQEKANQDLIPVVGGSSTARNMYLYWFKFSKTNEQPNKYVQRRVETAEQAIDFIIQFLSTSTSLATNETSYDDLIGVYDTVGGWFIDKFDGKYFYNLLTTSEKYSKYRGISLGDVKRFEDLYEDKSWIGTLGNERAPEFRDIVAQQFICSFEAHEEIAKGQSPYH